MGTAADDLRDREEELYDDHLMGWCRVFAGCPYCAKERRELMQAARALDRQKES